MQGCFMGTLGNVVIELVRIGSSVEECFHHTSLIIRFKMIVRFAGHVQRKSFQVISFRESIDVATTV